MKKKRQNTGQYPIYRKIIGMCVASLAIFLMLALVSYSAIDPGWNHATDADNIHNWMGIIGAYTASGLMIVFGFAAFVVPLFMLEYADRYSREHKSLGWLNLLSTSIIIFVLPSFIGVVFRNEVAAFNDEMIPGGAIGQIVGAALVKYLNTWGALILLATLLAAGLMVGYDLAALYAKMRQLAEQTLTRCRERITAVPEEPAQPEQNPKKIKAAKKLSATKDPQITIVETKEKDPAEIPIQAKLDFAGSYQLPPLSLINEDKSEVRPITTKELKANAALIISKLNDFGVSGEILEIKPGPVITMYEFTPAPGIKINRIVNLADDLAMALKANSIRVVAPIPGKDAVGIEIPNRTRETVGLRKVLASRDFAATGSQLLLALGVDTEGSPVVTDLAKMPHLLIAGATGTGKSVGLNTMILSLLYRCNPSELKFIMIDPKRIELSHFEDIPHLLHPVVTDPHDALPVLKWAVSEMEMRYELFRQLGCKGLDAYNKKIRKNRNDIPSGLASVKNESDEPVLLPKMVIIIDEFADLMMVNKEVETYIARLAQMARAAGMHLIVATQRPSVDVITGLIKANFPSRISFRVSSKTDARTILDGSGADQLLGMGDMLFRTPGATGLMRVHGAYVSEEELDSVVGFIKDQMEPDYLQAVEEQITRICLADANGGSGDNGEFDPIYDQALDFVSRKGVASISLIQRQFSVGYNKAAKLIEQMEADGVIGPPEKAGRPRKVLVKSYAEMDE